MSRGIQLAWLVLNLKIVTKQLADPCVLWNCSEPLIQQVLEAAMICANNEFPRPKIRPPMPDRLNQPNKLALISRELGVLGGQPTD